MWAHPITPVASTTAITVLRSLTIPKSFPFHGGSDETLTAADRPVSFVLARSDCTARHDAVDSPASATKSDAKVVLTVSFIGRTHLEE
jgi:hypothetical protein